MLVDTSVWINYFNGHASAQADRLERAIADGEPVTITGLVLTEILLGLSSEAEALRIMALLDAFDYINGPEYSDYLEAARIYRAYRSKGDTIRSTVDCLIAQLCLREGLPLLCKDRDFYAISQCVALHFISVILLSCHLAMVLLD